MEKTVYITEEEREKCRKVIDVFEELYEIEDEDILLVDVGRYGFVKLQCYTASHGFEELDTYTDSNSLFAGKMDRVKEGFGAGRNLVWLLCVPLVVLYFFFGRFLLLLFMNDPQGPAIDTGMLFLRILSPFYFVVSVKLVADGILRGCGLMVRFMIATFTDLILRVGIAAVLSATALGSTGIWMAWPVGWCIGTALSMVFYVTAIRKALAEPVAVAEAEGQAAEVRAEAEFAADAEMETL